MLQPLSNQPERVSTVPCDPRHQPVLTEREASIARAKQAQYTERRAAIHHISAKHPKYGVEELLRWYPEALPGIQILLDLQAEHGYGVIAGLVQKAALEQGL